MPDTDINRIRRELQEKIGNEKVSNEEEMLKFFSSDDSIQPDNKPDLVVSPSTIKDIQEIF